MKRGSLCSDTTATPPELFRGLVEKAWKLYDMPETNEYLAIEPYLVDVLIQFWSAGKGIREQPSFSLGILETLSVGGKEATAKIKRIGDAALTIASILTARRRTQYRIVPVSYYTNIAATAYQMLYDRIIKNVGKAIMFGTLAGDTKRFVRILAYVIRMGRLNIDMDVMTEILEQKDNREWLREQGILSRTKRILQ